MVYCEGVECNSKLGKLLQAFRCDRPDEWQMDEFIGMAEKMQNERDELAKEVERLRESLASSFMAGWEEGVNGMENDEAEVAANEIACQFSRS